MDTPVDYTSRDYTSIREDLVNLIPSRLPEWTSRSQNDFGIILLELFAYMGDILNFYIDRVANEAFLSTASQRSSVLELARLLDYTPASATPATVTLTFSNAGVSTAVIPQYTQVSTATISGDYVVFTTDAEVSIDAAGNDTVTATEGVVYLAESLGVSDGAQDQDFTLFRTGVTEGSVSVYVDEGAGAVEWTYQSHLLDATSTDPCYTLVVDGDGVVHIVFGDGVNGRIPTTGSAISADYRTGGGVRGNVVGATLTTIRTTVPAGVTVNNSDAATGGVDAESLDEIRINAPKSLFSLRRAVTLADYVNLAETVPGIAKASGNSSSPSVVELFVAPSGGGIATTAVKSAVSTYLADKKPHTTTVTLSDPTYVTINITCEVHVLPQYLQETVRLTVVQALKTLLSFDYVTFEDRISMADVYSTIMSVPGVSYGTVSVLSTSGSGASDITTQINEIPSAGSVTATATGGIIEA